MPKGFYLMIGYNDAKIVQFLGNRSHLGHQFVCLPQPQVYFLRLARYFWPLSAFDKSDVYFLAKNFVGWKSWVLSFCCH